MIKHIIIIVGWGFSIRKERVMSTISFLCFHCYSCWFRGSWAEMAAFAIPRTARKPVMLTRQWNTVYRKQCKCWWILLLLPWVNGLPVVTANASLHVLRLCVGGTSRAGRIPVPLPRQVWCIRYRGTTCWSGIKNNHQCQGPTSPRCWSYPATSGPTREIIIIPSSDEEDGDAAYYGASDRPPAVEYR